MHVFCAASSLPQSSAFAPWLQPHGIAQEQQLARCVQCVCARSSLSCYLQQWLPKAPEPAP